MLFCNSSFGLICSPLVAVVGPMTFQNPKVFIFLVNSVPQESMMIRGLTYMHSYMYAQCYNKWRKNWYR